MITPVTSSRNAKIASRPSVEALRLVTFGLLHHLEHNYICKMHLETTPNLAVFVTFPHPILLPTSCVSVIRFCQSATNYLKGAYWPRVRTSSASSLNLVPTLTTYIDPEFCLPCLSSTFTAVPVDLPDHERKVGAHERAEPGLVAHTRARG